jgi:hypothetical protein
MGRYQLAARKSLVICGKASSDNYWRIIMFARVSTYRPAPDNTGEPSEETVDRVLGLPGCMGMYYLAGKEGRSLSITLWDSEESLVGSQQPANLIRSETSAKQHLAVLQVEEFEVLTHQLKD